MDDKERVKLDQMLKDNDVENMTSKIRELRHSSSNIRKCKIND